MCGIACVIGSQLPDERVAARARDLLEHRGPDGLGEFRAEHAWLAHRRLAIIDVGDSGHQPFRDDESGVSLVFNGEIFNYVELRRELERHGHRFRSRSDTEVLLRSYLEWGPSCLERFNGMWAFVIWDPRERHAFFSRDRFGAKPLFMAKVPGGLALASEPKALLTLYPRLREPDKVAIGRLLAEKRVYADGRSFYRSISVFPAAHWGAFAPGDGAPTLRRFWDFPSSDENELLSGPEIQRRFQTLFEDGVRLRLRSDVPLALTLSGGLDSTAILHAARAGLAPRTMVRAYTAAYPEADASTDEREEARLAVEPYGNTELREVIASADDFLETLRRIVWHMDGPGFSPAVLPVWRIMDAARADGVKVLLEGMGADELLGGYASHVAAGLSDDIARALRERSVSAMAAALATARGVPGAFPVRRVLGDLIGARSAAAHRWDMRRSTVVDALRPEVVPPPDPGSRPDPGSANGRDRLGQKLLADFARDLLPSFLHYGDAISMAHSVESRLPFLDHRLVEFCFRLPGEQRLRGGQTKAVLRAYLRKVGQGTIAERRRKRAYPTPTNTWLARNDGAVLREILLDPGAFTRTYVVPEEVERLIDRHVRGMLAAGDVLFGLLSTELWLSECVYG